MSKIEYAAARAVRGTQSFVINSSSINVDHSDELPLWPFYTQKYR